MPSEPDTRPRSHSPVAVPEGGGREGRSRPCLLSYFKRHDFILVCSEAAQMGRIHSRHHGAMRGPRFEAADLSCLPGGRREPGTGVCEADESAVWVFFFFCFLLFLFKASEHCANIATVHETKFQIHLKNGTRRTAGQVAKPVSLVGANCGEHSSSHCRHRKVHPHKGAEETENPTAPAGTWLKADRAPTRQLLRQTHL